MTNPVDGDDELFPFADEDVSDSVSAPEGAAEPWRILIVDDDEEVHSITRLVLGDFPFLGRPMTFISAYSAAEARAVLENDSDIAVILLDVVMESDDAGLDLVKAIRDELGNHEVRIILRTGQPGRAPERRVIAEYDINDYRAKAELTADNLFSTTVAALRSYRDMTTITHLYEQLKSAQEATVVALADLAEFKDTDTGDHVLRIRDYTHAIAEKLGRDGPYAGRIDDAWVVSVGMASILHDVGKVGIPDAILQKPAKLDAEEWKVMLTHAEKGEAILERAGRMVKGTSYLGLGAEIAGSHHEKFDGSGYPRGLAGQDIPLSGRIVAVADVFDALTSKRPYKDPWPLEKAVEEIRNSAGTHFDPAVVEAFVDSVATAKRKEQE